MTLKQRELEIRTKCYNIVRFSVMPVFKISHIKLQKLNRGRKLTLLTQWLFSHIRIH